MTTHQLPDDLRVPLHSLQADIPYLLGRVASDGSASSIARESIENRLSQIETACYHQNATLTSAKAEIEKLKEAVPQEPTACVSVMQTSAGPEYYVQFDCGGRTTTPYRFKERYKAEYHVAHFNWIFHGGDEPQLMDYNPESWPGKPLSSLPEPRT